MRDDELGLGGAGFGDLMDAILKWDPALRRVCAAVYGKASLLARHQPFR